MGNRFWKPLVGMMIMAAMGMAEGCGGAASAANNDASSDIVLAPRAWQKAVDSDSTAVVLDLRTPEEYAEGHVKGARNVDYLDTALFNAEVSKLDPTRTYYIYCRSGRRSHAASEIMEKEGLKTVDMEGGILAWQQDGLPLE